VIILARAGLSLDISLLRKVGRSALLMCFVPACFEIAGMILIAPKLLGVSIVDAAIMGATVAAVSPAVVVPLMLKLIDKGYGKDKSIPQLIMAGASVDDVFVIVIFTSFTSVAKGGEMSAENFISIPISIISGIVLGIIAGVVLAKIFSKFRSRNSVKVLIFISAAFVLLSAETLLEGVFPISGLLGIMAMGAALLKRKSDSAKQISGSLNEIWIPAEILLFVLVGACVDVKYAVSAGFAAVILILLVLIFRMLGVLLCLVGTRLNRKERLFCMIAYSPKATVQAAIGGIPLAMGLSCGNIVLTVAVLSIIITAPLGAFLIEKTYKKLLVKN
jgi:NhaP-type Na+/H+ or K+/H+ antiporter